MKEKELFDMLENAEDAQVEELAESCPELTEAQLGRLLAKSEKKYIERKPAERQKSKNGEEFGDTASGVDRISRPVWLTPLYTAASLLLVVGMIAGGAVLFRHRGGDDIVIQPSGAITTDECTTIVTTTTAETSTAQTAFTTAASEEETTTTINYEESVYDNETGEWSPYIYPEADSLSTDGTCGEIAFDLAERSEEVYLISDGAVEREKPSGSLNYYGENAIWFTVDPSDDVYPYNYYDYKNQKMSDVPSVLFELVTDSRVSCTDDIKALLRSVYTEDNESYMWSCERLGSGCFDDLNVGDLLKADTCYWYIDYRGQLYVVGATGGKGYLGTTYFNDRPVIITDKTDSSFTAFVPYINTTRPLNEINEDDYPKGCAEFSIVYDTEVDGWRIESSTTLSYTIYKNLRKMATGE